MTPEYAEAKKAAEAADAEFSAHLERVYGEDRMGDMRYRPDLWGDDSLISAAEDFMKKNSILRRLRMRQC